VPQSRPRRISVWPVLVYCSFIGVAWTPPRPLAAQNSEAARLAQSAAQKYQAGDLTGAIAAYRQAAALQPNDASIFFALAQALGDQGATEEAAADYQKTLQLYDQLQARGARSGLNFKPNMAMVWNNLAVLYCRDQHYDQARSAIDRAFSLWSNPGSVPARFFVTRGMVLEGLKQPDAAVEAYQTALQKDPRNADALLDLGSLLLAHSRADDALGILERGATVAPDDPEMFAALGNAFAKKESWPEAAEAYNKSLALRPDRAEIMFNLATALDHQAKSADSLAVLQRAHQIAPGDPAISARLAAVLASSGKRKEATGVLAATTPQPLTGDPWTGYTRASALSDQGQKADALALINDVLHAQPDFPEATALWGSLMLEMNRGREGAKPVADALASHPGSPELLNATGLIQMAEMRLPQAEASFSKALTLKPAFLDARVNHAIALLLQHRRAPAITEFQEALKTDPGNLKAHSNLAAALFESGEYAQACEEYSRAIERSPDDADLRENLGSALEKAGRREESKRAFAEAKRLRGSAQ
jgi:protein O-GlcNAc transferase